MGRRRRDRREERMRMRKISLRERKACIGTSWEYLPGGTLGEQVSINTAADHQCAPYMLQLVKHLGMFWALF